MLSVFIRIASMRHNIQFHDRIRKKSLNICFLELLEEFVGTEKRVRIIHGKRAIGVILYNEEEGR